MANVEGYDLRLSVSGFSAVNYSRCYVLYGGLMTKDSKQKQALNKKKKIEVALITKT